MCKVHLTYLINSSKPANTGNLINFPFKWGPDWQEQVFVSWAASLRSGWGPKKIVQKCLMAWVIQLYLKQGANTAFWYLNVLLCNEVSSFSGRVADIRTQQERPTIFSSCWWDGHLIPQSGFGTCVNVALDHTARAARADLTSVWLDWVEVRPAGRPLSSRSAYSFCRKSVMTPTLRGPALLSWGMGLSPRLWRYVTATSCRFLCGCFTALWWASIETSLVLPADRDATQWIGPLLYQSDYHRHISSLSP